MNKDIIVALDFPDAATALAMVEKLDPSICHLKVGKELFTAAGNGLVETLTKKGFDVFLDLKYHDIPNTVAGACRVAADLGVWMLNIHASGGRKMMEAAAKSLQNLSHAPLLIGVTVLTSMEQEDLVEIGINVEPEEQVLRLARLSQNCGLDGVVCSGKEASLLRSELMPNGFKLVTPGIRFAGEDQDDQRRVVTPKDAVKFGADFIVMGRAITGSNNPIDALQKAYTEMKEV